ncbi:iron ABC transporter permease [Synechococcus elongatus PCC 11802]|uniref:Iron ABC transporter permease n=2 Tax=Synechococcus elongatus TaxID=32046 RepID=A0AAT9JY38_SYNEL|nr:iron ABC transporter permease [Synechococcus elongatus]
MSAVSSPTAVTPPPQHWPTLMARRGWTALTLGLALLVAAPILVILASLFTQQSEVWAHLAATVLPEYVRHSLVLLFGVGFGVAVIGTATAWLVTACRFPGSRWMQWGLLLPLATPTYLLAYTLSDFLDYYGPVQGLLRDLFGWSSSQDYWFPSIRSLPGAVLLFSLTLYPYVYLLARSSFLEQSHCTVEAARSLGCSPWQSFWRVALPLARPAIAAGMALALMETLNDFGAVQYLGVNTFTTGIYRTWLGLGDRPAATQLSAVLLLFIAVLLILEWMSRRQARFYEAGSRYAEAPVYQLRGWRAGLAAIICLVPVLLGLVLPVGILLELAIHYSEEGSTDNLLDLTRHSLLLAGITAILATFLGLTVSYGQRLQKSWLIQLAVRTASLGYAIPGSVLAVGILLALGGLDQGLTALSDRLGGTAPILLTGTLVGLVFAYLVRFLAIAFSGIESSLAKIRPSYDEAARSLGESSSGVLRRIHLPLLSGGLLSVSMLVFVDVMKELPATLVMRPFNFDTLAVRVYQYASDERLAEAALPALMILAAGLLPVILISRQVTQSAVRRPRLDPD